MKCFHGPFIVMAWEGCLCKLTAVLTMHRAGRPPHSTAEVHLVQATWSDEVEPVGLERNGFLPIL